MGLPTKVAGNIFVLGWLVWRISHDLNCGECYQWSLKPEPGGRCREYYHKEDESWFFLELIASVDPSEEEIKIFIS